VSVNNELLNDPRVTQAASDLLKIAEDPGGMGDHVIGQVVTVRERLILLLDEFGLYTPGLKELARAVLYEASSNGTRDTLRDDGWPNLAKAIDRLATLADKTGKENPKKIAVTLHIEATEWALGRPFEGVDQWVRSWKDWPDERELAARVVCIKDDHYRWTCWGIYSEGHIGYGRANTLEEAMEMSDKTLVEYCHASEMSL